MTSCAMTSYRSECVCDTTLTADQRVCCRSCANGSYTRNIATITEMSDTISELQKALEQKRYRIEDLEEEVKGQVLEVEDLSEIVESLDCWARSGLVQGYLKEVVKMKRSTNA